MPEKKATTPAQNATYLQILEEVRQGPSTRRHLYHQLEEFWPGTKVVALFTSFARPAMLENADADMLEEVLQSSSTDKKDLVLIIKH